MVNYIPQERDIVYINFSPIKGHEQKGVRPALVLSNRLFNQFTNMVVLCPISTNNKTFPTHYQFKSLKKINGSALCEHLRSADFKERHIDFIEKCSKEDYDEVIELVKCFFDGN